MIRFIQFHSCCLPSRTNMSFLPTSGWVMGCAPPPPPSLTPSLSLQPTQSNTSLRGHQPTIPHSLGHTYICYEKLLAIDQPPLRTHQAFKPVFAVSSHFYSSAFFSEAHKPNREKTFFQSEEISTCIRHVATRRLRTHLLVWRCKKSKLCHTSLQKVFPALLTLSDWATENPMNHNQ